MPPTIKVIEIDHGWADIRERVLQLGHAGGGIVRVGVQGAPAAANHQNKRITTAQIATVHEYGKIIHQPARLGKAGNVIKARVIKIPARSFIRDTVDMFAEAIARREALLAYGVLIGKIALRSGLELFGMYAVGLMQQRIADRIPPANRPSTIRRKGSSVPLIDSGQLRASITHKVEGAGP